MLYSFAWFYVLFQAIENCVATAGFSVGEFAALVFSGVLSFPDGMLIYIAIKRLCLVCSNHISEKLYVYVQYILTALKKKSLGNNMCKTNIKSRILGICFTF